MAIRREEAALLRLETDAPGRTSLSGAVQEATPALHRPTLRLTRKGLMFAVWLIGGGAVLAYGLLLVYVNIAVIEVDSAIVAGTVVPLRAPASGVVAALSLRPGDPFRQGDQLFSVQNPDLEQAIALADIAVQEARDNVRLSQAMHTAELARRDTYLTWTRAQLAKTNEEVSALEQVERSLRTRTTTMTQLFAQGLTSRLRLDEVLQLSGEAHARLAHERSLQTEQRGLLEGLLAGTGHGPSEDVVRLADAEIASQRATADLTQAERKLRVLTERRAAMAVTASAPGRMLRTLHPEGSQVMAGDTVAVTEGDDDRLIYAFLTQSEIRRVAVGDDAQLVLPAYRLAARVRVVTVERSGGYLDDVENRYRWNLFRDTGERATDRDRTARVTLQFVGDDVAASRRVEFGTPVVVSFDRRWTDGVFAGAFGPLSGLK